MIGLAFSYLKKHWISLIFLSSERIVQAVSLWKNTCIILERQNKNKIKDLFHPLSEPSAQCFCCCSPGTGGLCLTTAQMAWERSTWPGWRNALEKHLGDCTSSPRMGSWSWSRDTMPPSSSSWKRCVSGLRKLFSVWQDWHALPLLFRLLRGKQAVKGDHEMVNDPEIYEN